MHFHCVPQCATHIVCASMQCLHAITQSCAVTVSSVRLRRKLSTKPFLLFFTMKKQTGDLNKLIQTSSNLVQLKNQTAYVSFLMFYQTRLLTGKVIFKIKKLFVFNFITINLVNM